MGIAVLVLLAAGAGWDAQFRSGEALDRAGQYAASAAAFEAALNDTRFFPETDWRPPVTLHNLGAVYRQLGRNSDAERCYRRAIDIFERRQPGRKAELASSLYNLGALYLAMGQPSNAEPFYRRSYQLRLVALKPGDPVLGASLHGLARVAQERRRFAEAEDDYRRAGDILERAYGPRSTELADLLHNWAMLHRDEGRDAEARPMLVRAASMYDPSHPKLAVILRNLAELEAAAGNVAEGARLFGRSIAICEATLPPDHPQTGIILEAYARFLRQTNRKKEAAVAASRARAILRNHPGYSVDVSDFR